LANINIKTVHIPMKNTIKTIRSREDTLSTETPGVYCTPCDCGKVSVQQTGRNIETQCKKYMRHLCLGQLEASALAERVMDAGEFIKFNNTCRLGMATDYMDHGL